MSQIIAFLAAHDQEWFVGDDGAVRIVSHLVSRDGAWSTEIEAVASVADARRVLGY